jgi:hypothetical protein
MRLHLPVQAFHTYTQLHDSPTRSLRRAPTRDPFADVFRPRCLESTRRGTPIEFWLSYTRLNTPSRNFPLPLTCRLRGSTNAQLRRVSCSCVDYFSLVAHLVVCLLPLAVRLFGPLMTSNIGYNCNWLMRGFTPGQGPPQPGRPLRTHLMLSCGTAAAWRILRTGIQSSCSSRPAKNVSFPDTLLLVLRPREEAQCLSNTVGRDGYRLLQSSPLGFSLAKVRWVKRLC